MSKLLGKAGELASRLAIGGAALPVITSSAGLPASPINGQEVMLILGGEHRMLTYNSTLLKWVSSTERHQIPIGRSITGQIPNATGWQDMRLGTYTVIDRLGDMYVAGFKPQYRSIAWYQTGVAVGLRHRHQFSTIGQSSARASALVIGTQSNLTAGGGPGTWLASTADWEDILTSPGANLLSVVTPQAGDFLTVQADVNPDTANANHYLLNVDFQLRWINI